MQGLVERAADLDQAYLLPTLEAQGVHHAQACLSPRLVVQGDASAHARIQPVENPVEACP